MYHHRIVIDVINSITPEELFQGMVGQERTTLQGGKNDGDQF